jgi:hypothetical protein
VKEILPRFAFDLHEYDPGLFNAVAAIKPEIILLKDNANRKPVRLDWLTQRGWSGKAVINGLDCFVYSRGHVEFKIDKLSEFPDAIGEIEVDVTLPGDTPVYPDATNYKFMRLMNKAKEENAFVEELPQ